jgi:hypothetical protein
LVEELVEETELVYCGHGDTGIYWGYCNLEEHLMREHQHTSIHTHTIKPVSSSVLLHVEKGCIDDC